MPRLGPKCFLFGRAWADGTGTTNRIPSMAATSPPPNACLKPMPAWAVTRRLLNNRCVLPVVWLPGWDDHWVQGAGDRDPDLMDARALVGHLVPAGSVFA